MAVERWLAVTSVGLFAMFAGQMVSVYNFMSDAPEDDFAASFDADPKLLQFISISVAPGGILAAVAFLMSKQYGSRLVGLLIMADGAILLAGMLAANSFVDRIAPEYITDAVVILPPIFAVLAAPTVIIGASLLKSRGKRPKMY